MFWSFFKIVLLLLLSIYHAIVVGPDAQDNILYREEFEDTGPSWPWSYDRWIYDYLCNQCLSLLMLCVRISIRAWGTTLCDTVCQWWLATGRWYSPGPPVSSTNKTDHHDITEILLKVALNTTKQTNQRGNQNP